MPVSYARRSSFWCRFSRGGVHHRLATALRSPGLRLPLGGVLVAMATALFSSSIGQLRRAGTPVPGNQPTTAIVCTGPYRFSRNPIYLAFFAAHLGVAIWVNSVWLVATSIASVAIVAVVVVPREERYLTRRFGAEYLAYKTSVRRWL
jgi:protein-S-isoprenylcysteine O-methyltransferase Ste14